MHALLEPLMLPCGKRMRNRLMLAPLTNCQSATDGRLSEEEFRWLTLRAEGGFGLVMTCAAHVQANGQGFPGQLGIFGDEHLPGLTRLAGAIKAAGALAVVQLHHAGNRAPEALIGQAPVCPSDDPKSGARALTAAEVEQVSEDFVRAAERAEAAGFDGVELHGAHGYLLCQFLSARFNRRQDSYGGSLENRSRILFSLIDGIRTRCRPDFLLSVRLSPERFGMDLGEVREVAQRLIGTGKLDVLDLSLWDCWKKPEDPRFQGRALIDWFMDLERRGVRLGVAGKLHDPEDAERALAAGADLAILGRVGILHHDFPNRLALDPAWRPLRPPVTSAHLREEGLGEAFIRYLDTWPGFVAPE